jgi:hypothetical protein
MGKESRTYRWGPDQTANQHRLTVYGAARRLGISEDAVRMRIKRGTLAANKEGGRLYVLLDAEPTSEPTPDHTAELIATLREHLEAERRALQAERDAHAESRRLLLQAVQKIPDAIEPPQEPPQEPSEASETATARPGRVGQPSLTGAQEPDTRERQVPWWRRVLGG